MVVVVLHRSQIAEASSTHFRPALANCNHTFRQIGPDSVCCTVVHGDDWVLPNCLIEVVSVAQAYPSVGMVSAYRLEQDRLDLDGLPYPSTSLLGRTVGRMSLLRDLYVFGSPTSLLPRSDLVRSRRAMYDESVPHADTELSFELLSDHDFGFVHQVLSFTRRHNESRTSLTQQFNTHHLGNYAVFLKHGPEFLIPTEYRQCLARWHEDYERYLARSAFDLRDREFWTYQRAELKKLGQPLRSARNKRALAIELLDFRTALCQVGQALRQRKQSAPTVGALCAQRALSLEGLTMTGRNHG